MEMDSLIDEMEMSQAERREYVKALFSQWQESRSMLQEFLKSLRKHQPSNVIPGTHILF